MSLDLSKSGFNIEAEKASNTGNKLIKYGTAGFRANAEDLNHILYRIGILSVLRSKKKNGQTIGLMITASHNPEQDNGVKLIDPYGEMLEQSWEQLATDLANAEDNNLTRVIERIIQDEKIDMNIPASVFLGRDTRSSSPRLLNLAVDGVKSANGAYKDYGVVTTPVLHYMVYSKNVDHKEPIENDYDLKLSNAFKKLNDGASFGNYMTELLVDGANGVGAVKIKQMEQHLKDTLRIRIYNDGNGALNYKCGADFVKVDQKAPEGVPLEINARCVSLDGDADRLIYYYIDSNQVFHMLDGDRIAILIAEYLIKLVRDSKVNVNLGLVQTAYANGGSTNYITNTLKIPVACVPTGVKHLHHKALEFDIGVYFEANGHGTVVYSKAAEEAIRSKANADNIPESEKKAAENLLNMIDLTNQTVGDAFSDVLLVETVLKAKGWSLADWEKVYSDLPNRQLKVTIKDRNVIKTTDAERICVSPEGLQDKINELVRKYENGRAFARASGTEDVVRVYAESSTRENSDKLASEVALAVYQLAGGVGNPPVVKS